MSKKLIWFVFELVFIMVLIRCAKSKSQKKWHTRIPVGTIFWSLISAIQTCPGLLNSACHYAQYVSGKMAARRWQCFTGGIWMSLITNIDWHLRELCIYTWDLPPKKWKSFYILLELQVRLNIYKTLLKIDLHITVCSESVLTLKFLAQKITNFWCSIKTKKRNGGFYANWAKIS